MLAANYDDGVKDDEELIIQLIKPKTENLVKSRKSTKSKKPLKNENLPKFVAKKTGPNILIFDTKTVFNY